jgi:hypothetical protein
MVQQAATKVPFVLDNVGKCLCPECPVQAQSKCVAGLKSGLTVALKKNPLKHEEVPGVYCGAGKATCTDLDPKQSCMCGACTVYSHYGLAKGKPASYFCRAGTAR